RRRHPERVTFDPRTAMGGWAQPDDLRREADRPIVAVARDVVETGEDRHTVLCCAKAITLLRYFRCNFWAGRYLRRGSGATGGGGKREWPGPGEAGRSNATSLAKRALRPLPPKRIPPRSSPRGRNASALRPRKTRGGRNGERAMPAHPTGGHDPVYGGGMFCAPWKRLPGSNLLLTSRSRA